MVNMHMVHISGLAALDLNLMVALHALLTEANVTQAARRVALSQSATSHALARLRQLFGDPLLVRSGRQLKLTSRAMQLLPALERGLAEIESAVSGEPPFDPLTARRSFTIGMADYGQAVMLGPLLARLRQQAPGVDLTVLSPPNPFDLLEAGNLDLAVVVTGSVGPAFSARRLFSDGFVCMVRRGHPTVGTALTMKQYLSLGHVVVAPTGTPGSMVDTELDRRRVERRVTVRISSFLAAPIVVSQTDLVTTGPERLLRPMVKRYPVRLLPPPLRLARFELSLAWHGRLDHDPAHAWLRGIIAEAGEPQAAQGAADGKAPAAAAMLSSGRRASRGKRLLRGASTA